MRLGNDQEEEKLISFEHKFFVAMREGYFRKSSNGEPVYVIAMAGASEDSPEIVLPLNGIRREFKLDDDTPDGAMLKTVAESLNFIKVLWIGDPIPKEILTGEASWEVSDRDREIAYNRITLQLVNWMSGDERTVSNTAELLDLIESDEIKANINAAFGKAAESLGLGRDNKMEILDLIRALAEELAHIEALRNLFQEVKMIETKIRELHQVYNHDASVMDYLQPITRLIIFAAKEYQETFDQIDAQTGEIIAALRNIDAQLKYLHTARDNLYCRLVAWDEMFKLWQNQLVKRARKTEDLLRQTYQFLAPRFMQEDEWVLFSQLQNQKEMQTAMRW